MNRFLINLRSLNSSGVSSSDAQHFSQFSTANFKVPDSILGNIGQPLDHGTEHVDVDENVNILFASTSREDLEGRDEQPVAGPSAPRLSETVDIETVCLLITFSAFALLHL
jgi:hypothetical protein